MNASREGFAGGAKPGDALHAERAQCELCPRRCGVHRERGERGVCAAGPIAEVYRYGAHHGEEPPVSGREGSGTVFFSRCTMRCLYCQNYPWSRDGLGEAYDTDGLAGIFRELAEQGCINWNLVSPTPWWPQIARALARVKDGGLRLPVVYNTSGYERVETLDRVSPMVEIFLTDLRYASRRSALEGSGTADYVSVARAALMKMWEAAGPLVVEDGKAVRGTICRLLILPNRAAETVRNLRWIAEHIGTGIAVSVMAQYVPVCDAAQRTGWDRPIARAEYEQVRREVERLDFDQGWIQEFEGVVDHDLIGCEMKPGRGNVHGG